MEMDFRRLAGSQRCGSKVRLKKGGFLQCDKPALVVEVTVKQESHRCLMCRDHVRGWKESGLEIRVLEGDDSYIPRRPREFREKFAEYTCNICNRLWGEHSLREFDDHLDQFLAPSARLYPKGKRAKKEDALWYRKCQTCGRRVRDHSQQEYDACINQHMKRNKMKQEHLRYVKCEICSRKFGEHSSQEYEACLDRIIDNSV